MADNDWKSRLGMVYSTDPDFEYRTDERPETETLPPARQQLRVWLDRRQRAGKVVTLVRGFVGRGADLADLARLLKTRCGVGGAAKEGEIVIQGDHRDRVVEILTKAGYGCKIYGSYALIHSGDPEFQETAAGCKNERINENETDDAGSVI